MKILEELRAVKRELLTSPHPLRYADTYVRYPYLLGISLMLSRLEGPNLPIEQEIIRTLAVSLGLPEDYADRAIKSAKNADRSTICLVLESLQEPHHRVMFVVDLYRAALLDGHISSNEQEMIQLFIEIFRLKRNEMAAIRQFAEAATQGNSKKAQEALTRFGLPISNLRHYFAELKIDINHSPQKTLITALGISETIARKIIRNRPYSRISQLSSRKIVPQEVFELIKAWISAA